MATKRKLDSPKEQAGLAARVQALEQERDKLKAEFASGTDGETCQKCDRRYDTVWTTSDKLWHRIVMDHDGGLFCPMCFDVMARERGIWLTWYASQGALVEDTKFAAVGDMVSLLVKLRDWLRRLEKDSRQQAATCRYPSLKDACEHDAKNWSATAKSIDEVLKKVAIVTH